MIIFALLYFGFYIVIASIKLFGETLLTIDPATLIILIIALLSLLGGFMLYHYLARRSSRKSWNTYITLLLLSVTVTGIFLEFFNGHVIFGMFALPGLLLLSLPSNVYTWNTLIFGANFTGQLEGPTIVHMSFSGFFCLWIVASFTNIYYNWIFTTSSATLFILSVGWILWLLKSRHIPSGSIVNGEQKFAKPGETGSFLPSNYGWLAMIVLLMAVWHSYGRLFTYDGELSPLVGAWFSLLGLVLGTVMVVLVRVFLWCSSRTILFIALGSLMGFILFTSLIFYYNITSGNQGALWLGTLTLFCLPLAIGGSFIVQQDQVIKRKQHQRGILVIVGICIILILMLVTMQQQSETITFPLQLISAGFLTITYVGGLSSLAGQRYAAPPRTQSEGKNN